MASFIFSIYLLAVLTCLGFISLSYVRKRKTVYQIERIEFPAGMSAGVKLAIIDDFVKKNDIKEIKDIFTDYSRNEVKEDLNSCSHVYIDYIK